jgi:hypothetical protein
MTTLLMSDVGGGVLVFLFLAVIVAIWTVPMFIAAKRSHPQAVPIIMIDLFLGFTLIGWIVAFAWSLSAIPPRGGTR